MGELHLNLELSSGGGGDRSNRQPPHVEGGIDVLLFSFGLDLLAKVAATKQEAHRNER